MQKENLSKQNGNGIKRNVMRSIFLPIVVVFYGYKGIGRAFWLMFPIIYFVSEMQEDRQFFYSNYFMPFWITGTMIFYLIYGMLLKWMELMAKKYFA